LQVSLKQCMYLARLLTKSDFDPDLQIFTLKTFLSQAMTCHYSVKSIHTFLDSLSADTNITLCNLLQ